MKVSSSLSTGLKQSRHCPTCATRQGIRVEAGCSHAGAHRRGTQRENRARVERLTQSARRQASDYVDGLAASLRGDGIAAWSSVLTGRPVEVVPKYLASQHPGLVAITSHGQSGIGEWMLGSVASRVVAESDSPVLVVHPRREAASQPASIRSVIVPLDGSELAERALSHAEELADALGFTIIQVVIGAQHQNSPHYSMDLMPILGEMQGERGISGGSSWPLRRKVDGGLAHTNGLTGAGISTSRTRYRIAGPHDDPRAFGRRPPVIGQRGRGGGLSAPVLSRPT
jgi:nucleotide-binding universal stress UspA family protein